MNDFQTDARLVQSYLSGKQAAFEKIYDRYERPLFSYILKLLRDRTAAEDAFQQTWMQAVKALPAYREQSRFSSWLFGIAHNCCMDHLRRETTRREDGFQADQLDRREHDGGMPDYLAEKNEELTHLARAIDQLPAEQRAVVLMRVHGEIPFKDIAEALDCSLNTVLGRMHYAVKNLRKLLKENIGEDLTHVLS
ncbi:sigma-70 family RNA polymerase sigma factor [bacterium]|nr:sigma-70 family RNA polymerase sigma factor [bacterium]